MKGITSRIPAKALIAPAMWRMRVATPSAPRGRLFSVLSFTVTGGVVAEVNILADPERLRHLQPAVAGR